MSEIEEIPIEQVKVGEHEQRLGIDEQDIDELAASIARVGLLYPIIVRQDEDEYIVVEGHRRLLAHHKLGMPVIKCIIMQSNDGGIAEIAFAGNFFRKDLSPIELASALKDCIGKGNMDVKELAAGFHRSEHWVVSMIAIADWPDDVQEAVHCDGLSVSAAANLVCVTDERYRGFLVRNAIDGGATARTTASWLQAWRAMQPQEEAITAVPVLGGTPVVPLVPQAPCLCCSQLFEVNMMSHVPVCGACVQIIRSIGQT